MQYISGHQNDLGFTIKPGVRTELTDINGRRAVEKTRYFPSGVQMYSLLYTQKHNLFQGLNFPSMLDLQKYWSGKASSGIWNPQSLIQVWLWPYILVKSRLKRPVYYNYELNILMKIYRWLQLVSMIREDIFRQCYQHGSEIAYLEHGYLGKNKNHMQGL